MLKPRDSSSFVNVEPWKDMALQKRGRSTTPARKSKRARTGKWTVARRSVSAPPSRLKSKTAGGKMTKAMTVYRKRNLFRGSYGGKFTKLSRRSGRGMDKFFGKGCVSVEEITGVGNDKDCVYVMAEVINAERLFRNSIGSIIRLLLEKAGLIVTGWDDTPWPVAVGSGSVLTILEGGYIVGLSVHDLDAGSFSIVEAAQAGTENTFGQIVDKFVPYIKTWSQGFGQLSSSNDKTPYAFVLYKVTGDSANTGVTSTKLAEVVFAEAKVEFAGTVSVKVQNRSLPGTDQYNVEDVRANPLQGRMYSFRGVPRLKVIANEASTSGSYKFDQFYVDHYGLELFGDFNIDGNFKEPPPPALFWNCMKSSKIRLQPGEINSYGLYDHRKGMRPTDLWRSIKYQVTDSTGDFYNYSTYKTLLIALEDVINLSLGVANITVAVETERKLGCICYEKKRKFMKAKFEQQILV